MRMRYLALAGAINATAMATAGAAATAEPTPEQAAFFESKIRPILSDSCYKCHSLEQGKSKGGLTLDTKEGLLKGGENGAIITQCYHHIANFEILAEELETFFSRV